MPPHNQAASAQRRSKLETLLGIGRRALNQGHGGSAGIVSTFELTSAERVAMELADHLVKSESSPHPELEALWKHPSQDTAAILALFFLALRESSRFGIGDSPNSAYANIRHSLCEQFVIFLTTPGWEGFCAELLGPALLRADTLQCYCGLLAEAAEQLVPAAVQILPRAPGASASAPAVLRPQYPGLKRVQELLREPVAVLTVLGVGIGGNTPASRQLRLSVWDTIQTTRVLESWARVLLLGTAPAFGEQAGSRQQRDAQALQAHLLHRMADMHDLLQLDWADFLRGPCASTLASIHMAQLCSALDAATAFGVPKPPILVLQPLCTRSELVFVDHASQTAINSDTVSSGVGGVASLLTVLQTLRAWVALLCEELREALPCADAAASGDVGRQRPAAEAAEGPGEDAHGGGDGSRREASGSAAAARSAAPSVSFPRQQGADGQRAPGNEGQAEQPAGPCCLPPLNRSAAIALCLRLAKGLLAHWGRPVPGLRLDMIHRDHWDVNPRLPKVSGCAVVFHALACSRLALLPSLWCKERVEGRARARLRAWWEAYVAAAQHPEALLVASPALLNYPDWTYKGAGVPRRLCADAAVALGAGVLPCVTHKLARMTLGPAGGAVWCPPDRFPGTVHCWLEWMLFGPTTQVGELLAVLALRLRLTLRELRLAVSSLSVSSGGSGTGDSRRSRTAAVMSQVLAFTAQRLSNFFWGTMYTLKDAFVNPEQAQTGVKAVRRLSIAAAVLLPAVSEVVQGCVALRQLAVVAQGHSSKDDVVSLARRATDAVPGPMTGALQCVLVLLAAHAGAAAGEQQQQQNGAGGKGPGDGGKTAGGSGSGGGEGPGGGGEVASNGGSGSGGSDAGAGAGGRVVASSPWRALLLQDMQLMELLGAGVWLHGHVAAAVAAAQSGSSVVAENNERMRSALVWGLALAAAAFPAEFRAAWGVGGSAEGVASGPQGGSSSSSYAGRETPPSGARQLPACLMGTPGFEDELRTVACVLGGGDPSPGEVWDLACSYWRLHGFARDQLRVLVEAMLPPAEARAAMATAPVAAPAAAPAASAATAAS